MENNNSCKYSQAIGKVMAALVRDEVPFYIVPAFDGYQLRFPWTDGDVICHSGSYGHHGGFVETYHFPWDGDDVSMLDGWQTGEMISAYFKRK